MRVLGAVWDLLAEGSKWQVVAGVEAVSWRRDEPRLDARRDEFQALLAKYAATSPRLFGSVARGTARERSDIDILVEIDPADGNLLMRASGLIEETRALFGRDDIDVFPVQLLKRPISRSALEEAVAL
ncbi:MAG: nucleotidyltransferase domain-containing protein [Yaniella sp.]|nr:nucleotidyltransferase domain-containing protein [Yaniella sp.]